MVDKTKIEQGSVVYYAQTWTGFIVKAIVTEIVDGGVYAKELYTVDKEGNQVDRCVGSSGAAWDNLYATAAEAYDAQAAENKAAYDKYCSEIKSVEDLVRFPLEHCINGDEYTDWQAVNAYKIRAKELVGIEL
jgi:hypothetical protein